MLILLLFAFISGLVTILAPCIWPLLPIILSSTTTGEKRKPLGITLGIVVSFAAFTLSISYLVSLFHFDPDILRIVAVLVIGILGIALIVPKLSQILERYVASLTVLFGGHLIGKQTHGFFGGLITGLALGVVWSPCAGPILATIATIAATRTVSVEIVLVTVVYAIGVGIPLFLFATLGSLVFTKSKAISPYTNRIQQIFGVIMILTALAIYTNYDKIIQTKLLDFFPTYSTFLYKLESNDSVQKQLNELRNIKEDMKKDMPKTDSSTLPNLGPAPDFAGISNWLNTSEPLTIDKLKGKVVLVDFWTYTCINCIRTLPYVTSWYEKYNNPSLCSGTLRSSAAPTELKDKCFVVVGVHTPEFEFEKKTENVYAATHQYKINYPVAQDNDYQTWIAYNNHYWPAEYLIDTKGNIRKTHFGEGEYGEMEEAIQKLLEEAGQKADMPLLDITDQTPKTKLTPETYLGTRRRQPSDQVSLGGTWNVQDEYIESQKDSTLDLNFYADKVFLVITPLGQNDQVNVFLDGNAVDSGNGGKDIINGEIKLDASKLYNLIDLKGKDGSHKLHLEFKTTGVKIFAFTFGD